MIRMLAMLESHDISHIKPCIIQCSSYSTEVLHIWDHGVLGFLSFQMTQNQPQFSSEQLGAIE